MKVQELETVTIDLVAVTVMMIELVRQVKEGLTVKKTMKTMMMMMPMTMRCKGMILLNIIRVKV